MARSTAERALAKLREIVRAWPETDERISHGAPTFWGGRKTFASFQNNLHGDGRIAIWCKATFDSQAILTESDPRIYFVPPYAGPSGWIGIRVDGDVDWNQVRALLEEGYRMVAPKRALRKLDAGLTQER